MKKFLKYSLFTIIAVIAPFLIANEVLRWTWFSNYPFKKMSRWDMLLIHSLPSNLRVRLPVGTMAPKVWEGKDAYWQLTVNSQKIRAPREIAAKTAGSFRILCLGDSITFGLDVDDNQTYPHQLEQILKQTTSAPSKPEVINAGVWGYTSRQGLIYLREKLLQFHPDLVIIEFGFNDSNAAMLSFNKDRKIMAGNIRNGSPARSATCIV